MLRRVNYNHITHGCYGYIVFYENFHRETSDQKYSFQWK